MSSDLKKDVHYAMDKFFSFAVKFKIPEQLDEAVDWAFKNKNPKGLSKLDIFQDIQNGLLLRIENEQNTDYIIFTK